MSKQISFEEMKKAVKHHCVNQYSCCYCKLLKVNNEEINSCFQDKNVEKSYYALFGKPKEFDLTDIKPGYLVKLRSEEILLVVTRNENSWILLSQQNESIAENTDYNNDMTESSPDAKHKCGSQYDIIEVYGYSKLYAIFDIKLRELLYRREEIIDQDTKVYIIEGVNNIEIAPNDVKYSSDDNQPIYIEIQNENSGTGISIESAKELIKSLQEIVTFIEEKNGKELRKEILTTIKSTSTKETSI